RAAHHDGGRGGVRAPGAGLPGVELLGVQAKGRRAVRPLDPRLLRYARATVGYLAACAGAGTVTGVLLVVQAGLLADVVARVFLGGADLAEVDAQLVALGGVVVARAVLVWAQ